MGRSKFAHRLRPEQRDSIVREYESGSAIRVLAEKYGVVYSAIRGLLVRKGIPRRRTGAPVTRELNEVVFDALNEEAAYWVGFIMADGCIHGNALSLGLSSKDKDHLYRFRDFLGSTHTIGADRQGSGFGGSGIYSSNLFAFRSTRITDRLRKLGVHPRKTHTAEAVPRLAHNRHFWRGVVDGDGSVSNYIYTNPTTGQQRRVSLIGLTGSERIVEQFLDFVRTICSTKVNYRPVPGAFAVLISGRYAVAVASAIYRRCKVALPRKMEKAKSMMELIR